MNGEEKGAKCDMESINNNYHSSPLKLDVALKSTLLDPDRVNIDDEEIFVQLPLTSLRDALITLQLVQKEKKLFECEAQINTLVMSEDGECVGTGICFQVKNRSMRKLLNETVISRWQEAEQVSPPLADIPHDNCDITCEQDLELDFSPLLDRQESKPSEERIIYDTRKIKRRGKVKKVKYALASSMIALLSCLSVFLHQSEKRITAEYPTAHLLSSRTFSKIIDLKFAKRMGKTFTANVGKNWNNMSRERKFSQVDNLYKHTFINFGISKLSLFGSKGRLVAQVRDGKIRLLNLLR